MELIEKIKRETAEIGIIGLGYVGLPLAIEFGKAGFHVKGFDIDPDKVESLLHGRSYIKYIPSKMLNGLLRQHKFTAAEDFYLAYSPEREDPNNKDFSIATVPKVVGGYTRQCLNAAEAIYGSIVIKTVPVSSTKVAEATKLLENIYRAVNIALLNELKMLFDKMGIDIYEVIEAAKTKPFGFQAFYPGPGLGSHCIPIDPF